MSYDKLVDYPLVFFCKMDHYFLFQPQKSPCSSVLLCIVCYSLNKRLINCLSDSQSGVGIRAETNTQVFTLCCESIQ